MFEHTCKSNHYITEGFSLLFQVVFIFAFLTIFFFAYVVSVEKGEFEDQMKYVVDEILTDNMEDTIFKNSKGISNDQLVGVISGAIDAIEFNSKKDSKNGIEEVNKQNVKTRKDAFIILGVVVSVMIVVVIAMLIIGYCIPIYHHVSEALWVILFVGLTELAFLQIVAKNYISADPNNVKRVIGSAIGKWIKENKK